MLTGSSLIHALLQYNYRLPACTWAGVGYLTELCINRSMISCDSVLISVEIHFTVWIDPDSGSEELTWPELVDIILRLTMGYHSTRDKVKKWRDSLCADLNQNLLCIMHMYYIIQASYHGGHNSSKSLLFGLIVFILVCIPEDWPSWDDDVIKVNDSIVITTAHPQ